MMPGHPTDKLSVFDFGRELLRTNDLDPVYVLLWEAQLPRPVLYRWLLAYFCFYHVGTACWITQAYAGKRFRIDSKYWERFEQAASSKDYPRAHERRHYRGKNAMDSYHFLREKGIDALFQPLIDYGTDTDTPLGVVMKGVQQWKGFGPWIAFKVADMLERLNIVRVSFDDGAAFLFDSPREGAEMLWANLHNDEERIPDDVGRWAVRMILIGLSASSSGSVAWVKGTAPHSRPVSGAPCPPDASGGAVLVSRRGARITDPVQSKWHDLLYSEKMLTAPLAPPRYERPINVQEVETILCKYKAYMNGHYRVGEDIRACREGLLRFARCDLSQVLLAAGEKGGLW
jgi:hypothetical protein